LTEASKVSRNSGAAIAGRVVLHNR
jgi:hypothetical protein